MNTEVFQCQWSIQSYGFPGGSYPETGKFLSLALKRANNNAEPHALVLSDHQPYLDGKESLRQPYDPNSFLAESVERSTDPVIRVAFILPVLSGYVARSDFVQRRLTGSEAAQTVRGFLHPLQQISAPAHDEQRLDALLESSIAGVLLRNGVKNFDLLQDELSNRLTFPWLVEKPIARKRLVWVGGRYAVSESENAWDAAFALGISLIIVDDHGHWLEDDSGPYAYFREQFVAMDITGDDGFVDRLLTTVRKLQETKKIDGIMATTDARLAKVAKVSEILGLPTSPVLAYEQSTNKAKVRLLEEDTGGAIVFSDFEQFQQRLQGEGLPEDIVYPLIVKPCLGWASECVTKVTNEKELIEAARKASNRHGSGRLRQPAFMIEKYVDGPEFDANFVLQDGKVAFFEVIDNFPSDADLPGSTSQANFLQGENVSPSILPERERDIIRNSIHRTILKLGFTWGVFHCEGRVVNSSMHYTSTAQGGGDLVPKDNITGTPYVFLHEINARTPGYMYCAASQLNYGVDFYALQQLFSVGDLDRFSNLVHQFRNGPQWHMAYVNFLPDKDGIMKTPDTIQQLLDNHRDVRDSIVASHTVILGGQRVYGATSSELLFLAWVLVVSRVSWADSLRLARNVREKFTYELETGE